MAIRKSWYAAGSVLLLVVITGLWQPGGVSTAVAQGGSPGAMALPVEAITVQPQALASALTTVGSLRADESVVIRPEISGRLAQIGFAEGTTVKRGSLLFELDPSVLAAALREAEVNLEIARIADRRGGELGSQQLISQSDRDRLRAELEVAKARVASARAQLAKTRLLAPFDGVVGLREVSVGEVLNPGQALVQLLRLDPIEVEFSLPESALAGVTTGMPVSLQVDLWPGESFTGRIHAIEPAVDVTSRSTRLRATVANPQHRLRPGLFARVQVGAGDAKALLVPEQALLQEGETRFVYRVIDGKAARTVVRTGQRVPGQVEIVEGIAAGDVVITAGQGKPMMHDGLPVTVLPAADAAADGDAG